MDGSKRTYTTKKLRPRPRSIALHEIRKYPKSTTDFVLKKAPFRRMILEMSH
jgi:hypothetical protein